MAFDGPSPGYGSLSFSLQSIAPTGKPLAFRGDAGVGGSLSFDGTLPPPPPSVGGFLVWAGPDVSSGFLEMAEISVQSASLGGLTMQEGNQVSGAIEWAEISVFGGSLTLATDSSSSGFLAFAALSSYLSGALAVVQQAETRTQTLSLSSGLFAGGFLELDQERVAVQYPEADLDGLIVTPWLVLVESSESSGSLGLGGPDEATSGSLSFDGTAP
jgi:hypothetical protein